MKQAKDSREPAVVLALEIIDKGKQAIVFAATKPSSEACAEEVAKEVGSRKYKVGSKERGSEQRTANGKEQAANNEQQVANGKEGEANSEQEEEGRKYEVGSKKEEWARLTNEALHALSSPTRQCRRLAKCLESGIAFHHSGLSSRQRDIVEDNFRKGVIKVICATPTLAFGLDLPAYRVVVKSVYRYGGMHGSYMIPVLEIQQMFGRAGRPKYDKEGEAICIATSEREKAEILQRYILGEPEEITSKLAVEPVLRTYVLSLVAAGFVSSVDELADFFKKTFYGFVYGDIFEIKKIVLRMVDLLASYKFIISKKAEFTRASEIGEEKLHATILGRRVAELYIDPYTANQLIKGMQAKANASEFTLLFLAASTLELRPYLTVYKKELGDMQEEINRVREALGCDVPEEYEEEYDTFVRQFKTAMFMDEWMNEKDEDYLLEKYKIRPGEIKAKLDRADWLFYAMQELAGILNLKDAKKLAMKTRFRLKNGIKEELMPLMSLVGIGRKRARKMYNAGIRDLGEVKKADITTLRQLIGPAVAADIKSQLGERVEKVPEGKRKGQLGLKDYQ